MKILLTNDDGIYAHGLWALYACLKDRHAVTVVAPDRERSAIGHAITLHEPLRTQPVEPRPGWGGVAVNGTPADCVKIGLHHLMAEKPDLVLSGINPGANTGVNINYSGTVSAAREAALSGIAAMAVSLDGDGQNGTAEAARIGQQLAEQLVAAPLPAGTFLNVNIPNVPAEEISGIRISRQGLAAFDQSFDRRQDPRRRTYFWQGVDGQKFEANPEVDGTALAEKYVTVTPLRCDMTQYSAMQQLEGWRVRLNGHFCSPRGCDQN